jgi:hypothetical protein
MMSQRRKNLVSGEEELREDRKRWRDFVAR